MLKLFFFLAAIACPPIVQETALPEINAFIIQFVEANMGKKVGRGECWDLAAEALDGAGADWDGSYVFGKKINPLKDAVLPGDIIQFERVMVERPEGNMIMKENYAHHTAVVYQVLGTGDFILAHQNTGYTGKKVGTSPLKLSHIKKGQYTFFRPIKE